MKPDIEGKFPVKAACRIADIDRDRFNEAVHAGNYPCAPEVIPGSTRMFDEIDLIILTIYGRLLKAEYTPSLAGRIACKIHEVLKQRPDEDEIVVLQTIPGTFEARAGSTFKATHTVSGLIFWAKNYVNIARIREFVRRDAAIEAESTDDEI